MLCKRSKEDSWERRGVRAEFSVQIDGCANKQDDRVLIFAATNRPQELDEGMSRAVQRPDPLGPRGAPVRGGVWANVDPPLCKLQQ